MDILRLIFKEWVKLPDVLKVETPNNKGASPYNYYTCMCKIVNKSNVILICMHTFRPYILHVFAVRSKRLILEIANIFYVCQHLALSPQIL